MDKELEKQIEGAIAATTAMFRAKEIDGPTYYKCLVSMAFEFSTVGEHLRAASITQGIPLEYFRDQQRKQMEEDGNYAYIAYTLALNLLQQGFVHLGPKATPTMPAASA